MSHRGIFNKTHLLSRDETSNTHTKLSPTKKRRRPPHPSCLCSPLSPPSEIVQGVAMSTSAVTPSRSFFVQTPVFSVSPSALVSSEYSNKHHHHQTFAKANRRLHGIGTPPTGTILRFASLPLSKTGSDFLVSRVLSALPVCSAYRD